MKNWTLCAKDRGALFPKFSITLLTLLLGLSMLWPGNVIGRPTLVSRPYYDLPPQIKKSGVFFSGSRVPLERQDVAERIEDQINYYLLDRRASLIDVLERLSVQGPVIGAALTEEKLPADLIYVAAAVSDLLPTAKTKSGGYGWWSLGSLKPNNTWSSTKEWDDRRDPVISTKLASSLFNQIRSKNSKFDWLFSIASFVDGTDKIELMAKKSPGFTYWDVVAPSFSETLIPRVVALKIINENRKYFEIDVPSTPPLEFDLVDNLKLNKDLPIRSLSQWLGVTPRRAWELNPGIDPTFGAFPKSDKRNPNATFLRVPKGSGQKAKALISSEGYM
ncbi:MAG: hypothetical protein AB7V04_12640 [Desulfomonilaceae bacterium]